MALYNQFPDMNSKYAQLTIIEYSCYIVQDHISSKSWLPLSWVDTMRSWYDLLLSTF